MAHLIMGVRAGVRGPRAIFHLRRVIAAAFWADYAPRVNSAKTGRPR